MCYLVAKNKNEHGCYVMQARLGERLAEFTSELDKKVAPKGIQLVTISRPEAYGEYAPYRLVKTEDEFARLVLSMAGIKN